MKSILSRHAAAIALAGLVATGTALATDLEVTTPWVRGTVAGQKATGAFMELRSAAGTTVVGVSSNVSGIAEIHEMKMDGGVMKMKAAPRLELPAGKPVSLAPGGYHVMLMDLKQPLKKGEMVTITLQLEGPNRKSESVEVKAEVRDLTAGTAAAGDEHRHGHGKH